MVVGVTYVYIPTWYMPNFGLFILQKILQSALVNAEGKFTPLTIISAFTGVARCTKWSE